MSKKCIVLLCSVFAVVSVVAQQLGNACFELRHSSVEAYSFTLSVSDFDIVPQGDFATLFVDGTFSSLQEVGKPQLPVFHQIIAVPQGAVPKLAYTQGQSRHISLGQSRLQPVQPHQFKNREQDFAIDNEIYSTDAFFACPLVSISELGTMQGLRLLRVTVSPFEYNPQRNTLLLHSDIGVEITFECADETATIRELQRFNGLSSVEAVANRAAFQNLLPEPTQIPPKYVVVARDTFAAALRPFVEWKRRKGFNVVEIYTSVGDSCTHIRARLDSIYRASSPLDPAPTFVTIVGDVEHVPSFDGKIRITGIGRHITDLYYAEYTGDFYPEAAYGRISVADTAELSSVLRKIMDYEQYRFADTAFLNRVTLVAGRESRTPAPTVTNGQINYLKNTYFSPNPDFDTHYYYNPASETQLPQIVMDLNRGASLVNYTSHCYSTGWYRPSFDYVGVDTLANTGKLFFAVNNCCLSSRFAETRCFGEALLRKRDAGAVSVIGAANETLWEEDYYWSLGAKGAVSLNPQYDALSLGAFDRMIHTHGEPYAQTAPTAGEMLLAGTFGLAQMGMAYENYYWEIYNLLGDPSLMPYLGVPQDITLDIPDSIPCGTTNIPLHGTPHTRVAFLQDSLLLASVLLDSNGDATADFSQPISQSQLYVTATAQFYKPLIDTLLTFVPSGSNVAISESRVSDTFGIVVENQQLVSGKGYTIDFKITNFGTDTAKNVILELLSLDGKSTIATGIFVLGDIAGHDTSRVSGYFVPDRNLSQNELLSLNVVVYCDSGDTCRRRYDFLAQSASVQMGVVAISQNGASVTQLSRGETYTLKVPVANDGSASADSVSLFAGMAARFGTVSSPDTVLFATLPPLSSDTAEFVFSVLANDVNYIDIAISAAHRGIVVEKMLRLPLGKAEETFESGDFTRFAWDTTHPKAWIIDTVASRAHAGSFCARTAPITHKQQSVLSIAMTTIVDDSISFWRRTSTEASADYLSFYVDDVRQGRWEGSGYWERMAFMVPQGRHVFKWVYEKDGSIDGGSDCAWIDDIVFPLSQMDTNCRMNPVLGISEFDGKKICTVYPNPAKAYFIVETVGNEAFEMSVCDAFGKIVDKKMIKPGEKLYYSTAKLRCGVYILLFSGKNDVFAKKIIITNK